MACIYLLNSHGGTRSLDFVITTYSYPLWIGIFCPMAGKCLLANTIYQTTVTQKGSGRVVTYTGLKSTYWKARLAEHKTVIIHGTKPGEKSSNSTELRPTFYISQFSQLLLNSNPLDTNT